MYLFFYKHRELSEGYYVHSNANFQQSGRAVASMRQRRQIHLFLCNRALFTIVLPRIQGSQYLSHCHLLQLFPRKVILMQEIMDINNVYVYSLIIVPVLGF